MTRTSAFRQRDIEKALKAARKQGVAARAIIVTPGGEIRLEFSERGPAPVSTADTPEAALARWQAEHGC